MESKQIWTGRGLIMAVLVVLAAPGCGQEVEPFGDGAMILDWDIAPLGCEASGIEEVEIELSDGQQTYQDRLPCSHRSASFDDLEPRRYDVQLIGYDGEDQARFGAERNDLLVRPDETIDLGIVDLVALPGAARVQWYFENQKVCGANDIEEVEVTAFDAAYYEVGRSTTSCDEGSVSVEGLRAGEYLFRVRAGSKDATFEGIGEGELQRGGAVDVDVKLLEVETR